MKKLIIISTLFLFIHSAGAEDMNPPSAENGQPSQQQSGQPPQQDGQPSQQGSQPAQQDGQPSQQGSQPAQQDGQPSQQGSQPAQQDGQPSQQSGQTTQQDGQPSARRNVPPAANTIRDAESRIEDAQQNNAIRRPGEIQLYGNFKWGASLQTVKKYFKRLRMKQENVENNIIRLNVILSIREKRFKTAQYYFTGKKLSGIRLEYRYQYVIFTNAKKEIVRLTKAYGNYKESDWNRKKVFKWESNKTLLYYSIVFNRNKAAYRIFRFYADKKNAATLLKFVPDSSLFTTPSAPSQPVTYLLKSENWYKADGTFSHRIHYEYNDKNQTTKLVQYNFIGQIELYTLFEYNSAGELIEEKTYANNNQPIETKKYFILNGKVVSSSITEYFGNQTKVRTVSYVRNENGDVVKEVWKDGSGNQLYIVEIKYNAYNLPEHIEHVKVYEREGREIRELFKKQIFTYNEDKKLIEIRTLEANGKLTQVIEYIYEEDRLKSTIVKQPAPNYNDDARRFLNKYIKQYTVNYEYIAR